MMTTMRDQEHGSQPSAVLLRKRAQDMHEEDVRKRKRYKEEQRLDADKEADKKAAAAVAETARLEADRQKLAQHLVNRKSDEAQILAKHRTKVYRCWLQTTYPAMLADRCIQMYTVEMTPASQKDFKYHVHRHLQEGRFQRHIFCPDLWDWDKNLTQHWGSTSTFHGRGQLRNIQCAQQFDNIIDTYARGPITTTEGAIGHVRSRDPKLMLDTLLEKCVPHSSKIFCGNYGVMKLLHINDYILEKTFVYAIFLLSKWLGPDIFSCGIYGYWPPAPPAGSHASDPDVLHVPQADEMPLTVPAASSTCPLPTEA
jgi:hypothetical protein